MKALEARQKKCDHKIMVILTICYLCVYLKVGYVADEKTMYPFLMKKKTNGLNQKQRPPIETSELVDGRFGFGKRIVLVSFQKHTIFHYNLDHYLACGDHGHCFIVAIPP
jgi:hypothetical protein